MYLLMLAYLISFFFTYMQVPEMLRMPLTELCLQIKSLSLGDIKSFLLKVRDLSLFLYLCV